MQQQNTKPKRKIVKLVVTKKTRVAEITDLIPGDVITYDGATGTIFDVKGSITDGLLNYVFTIAGSHREIKFTFKLQKA